MTANGWFQILFFLFAIFLVTKPLGIFMTRVFNREKTFLDRALRPIEKILYRLVGVDENHEMRWTEYTTAMLLFSGVSMTLLYLLERTQKWLPFVGSAAGLFSRLAGSRFSRGRPEPEALYHRRANRPTNCASDRRRRQDHVTASHTAADRAGTSGIARSDQGIWDKRRRILQCQQRAPF